MLPLIKTFKIIVLIVCFSIFSIKNGLANDMFNHWLDNFKKEALSSGISQNTIDLVFADVSFDQEIINKDRRQPEFVRTFKNYIDNGLSQERINKGKDLIKKHKAILQKVEKKYGIPPQYVIAFWGMETFYGKNFGNIPIINALATLAYDQRRSDFFKKELMNALKLIENNQLNHLQMKGSWAGALGNFQFMPSTYLSYAIDADNDGKKDLKDSLPDSFYSAANYLSSIGWKKGYAWGREVKLPRKFDYFLTGKQQVRTINEWKKLGVKNANNSRLPNSEIKAWILLPAGHQGPAFFAYENFDVIMEWNRSFLYALAIGLLADNISGRALLINEPPKEEKISLEKVIKIQEKLKEKGYYENEIDGILGSGTKNAIQNFQQDAKITADGYPSKKIMRLLGVDSSSQSVIKNIPIPKIKPQYVAPNTIN